MHLIPILTKCNNSFHYVCCDIHVFNNSHKLLIFLTNYIFHIVTLCEHINNSITAIIQIASEIWTMGNKIDKLPSKEDEEEGSTAEEKYLKQTKPGAGEIDVDDFRITIYPNIGQGSYGQVCKAVLLTTGTTVAAKGIKFTFGTDLDEKIRKMALEEADKMLMVDHLNIAKLLGYSHHLGTAWLFIEFCDLGDLDKYMFANPKLSLKSKLEIMRGIIEAVAYLHDHTLLSYTEISNLQIFS